MQPSIPAETCRTGWLTALSGKALRRLLSLTYWLFFNTLPVCLPHLSFFLSDCIFNTFEKSHFGSLPSCLSHLYSMSVNWTCSLSCFALCTRVCFSLPVVHPLSVLFVFLLLRHSFESQSARLSVCLPAVILLCPSYLFLSSYQFLWISLLPYLCTSLYLFVVFCIFPPYFSISIFFSSPFFGSFFFVPLSVFKSVNWNKEHVRKH